MDPAALIIYGRGDHLGNFALFASSLARELGPTFGKGNIIQRSIERRSHFFEFLTNPPLKHLQSIKQVHVFSHSIGAGLFFAYGDVAVHDLREQAVETAAKQARRITYLEALEVEVGAVLTDDLVRTPYQEMADRIRRNLHPDATIKLWGCNSGVSNWVYRDNGVVEPMDHRVPYYWRAFNERNVPKPAVAQAFANYFGVPCYGASSGAHIEILHQGKWISSEKYRSAQGKWPSGAFQHRLTPDRGNYAKYLPNAS